MSIVRDEPARAIRNAMERLSRVAAGTPLETHVAEERAIVEEALGAIAAPDTGEAVRRCDDCGRARGGEPGPCPWCDLFGAR